MSTREVFEGAHSNLIFGKICSREDLIVPTWLHTQSTTSFESLKICSSLIFLEFATFIRVQRVVNFTSLLDPL